MEPRPREAHLTIEFEGGRVTGEVRDERGAVSTFSGWLDLISALDSLSGDGDGMDGPPFTPAAEPGIDVGFCEQRPRCELTPEPKGDR